MKELTDFDTQRMHMQMHGRANFKDVVAYHEMLRKRRINVILWVLLIVSALLWWFLFSVGAMEQSRWMLGFAILFLIILIFRYGLHKKVNIGRMSGWSKKGDGWEKIDKLPDWAYRKMKRKHSNVVNGEHYRYKKEGNKFYRKLK